MSSVRLHLPSIDRILGTAAVTELVRRFGRTSARDGLREIQEELRNATAIPDWARDANGYAGALAPKLEALFGAGLKPIFNLTGTLLHTNFGRAVLGAGTIAAGVAAASSPVALEYDLDAGERGDRDTHVEPLLCALTGAEAATVVNNNAAALVLVLNTLALGRSVPVSRGELIEIGGSFRLPEIIVQAGCHIKEVGTTNRTHPADFAAAIDDSTTLLLKVHPSNYRIEGFARAPTVGEISEIGRANSLPLCVDLGSGTFIDMTRFGLPHEPTPREVLAQGADLVTFSGDKLLGSVQAGIVAGRADLIARIKRNPLRRALRCDKIRIAMLRHTLTLYADPDRLAAEIPLIRMLATPLDALDVRARRIIEVLSTRLTNVYRTSVRDSQCEVGSGALPQTTLPSRAVCIEATSDHELRDLARRLRSLPRPVIGRLNAGVLWLDVRAVEETDELVAGLAQLTFVPA